MSSEILQLLGSHAVDPSFFLVLFFHVMVRYPFYYFYRNSLNLEKISLLVNQKPGEKIAGKNFVDMRIF